MDYEKMSSMASMLSGFMLVISLIGSSGSLAGPMLNMVKVFKMVYSLRLINVFFGNILEAFLEALSKGFGSDAIPDDASV